MLARSVLTRADEVIEWTFRNAVIGAGEAPLWVMNCLADHKTVAAERPPIADTKGDGRRDRDGPIATQRIAANDRYSITSSARTRIESGIVNPIAFAVLRLRTISNFVACSTGRSAGFAPLKILSTKYAARRYIEGRFSP